MERVDRVKCPCGCGRNISPSEAEEMERENITHTTNVLGKDG